jgi:DNA-binding NarL/FixJ family response regulator
LIGGLRGVAARQGRNVAARVQRPEAQKEEHGKVLVLVGGGTLSKWKGLARCFSQEAGFLLVACSDTPDEISELAHRMCPAVIILDHELVYALETNGKGDLGFRFPVLVVTNTDEEVFLRHMLQVGCSGFLREPFSSVMLRRAVRSVASGELWASRRITSHLLKKALQEDGRRLTGREREVLVLIGRGRRNQDIASELCISRDTVRWHLRSLYAKLGVSDRAKLAYVARAS